MTAATFGAMFFFGSSAMAATVITPNPVPVSTGQTEVTVDVAWTQTSNQRLYFYQCFEDPSSPTFNYITSCSFNSELTVNPSAPTSGHQAFTLFRGAEPTGDLKWGCFAPGDTVPAGITKHETCYVRVTNLQPTNFTDQQFQAFTFTPLGAPVPEVPFAVVLPIAAVAVIGGGLVLQRRRQNATA
jgi:hypothetical protein